MPVLPIAADQRLCFLEIEIRCRGNRPISSDPGEIVGELIKSQLRGEVGGRNGPTRRTALRHIFERCKERIAFETPGEETLSIQMVIGEGGLVAIPSPVVRIPNLEPATWTDENCATAYEDLAASLLFLQPELTDLFGLTELTPNEFSDWLGKRGRWRPSFLGDVLSESRLNKHPSRPGSHSRRHIVETIRRRLEEGRIPGKTESWKVFMSGLRTDLGITSDKVTRGLSEPTVKRIVRRLCID